MSVAVEVMATNYLEQCFEVHCEYTRIDLYAKHQPVGGTARSEFFTAPFCRQFNFQVEITETNYISVLSAELIVPVAHSSLIDFNVYIVKCDGTKINITGDDHELDAPDECSRGHKFYFRFMIDIVSLDLTREHSGILKLYESIDGDLCDFEIRTNDGSLKVLKSILIIKWTYFSSMIHSKCSEYSNNIWLVDDFSYETMQSVIEFVYCDAITFEDKEHAMKRMEAGHHYLLDDLLSDCSKYLAAELCMENVLTMAVFSYMYGQNLLKEKCLIFIIKLLKFKDLEELEGYEEYIKYANHSKLTETCLQRAARQNLRGKRNSAKHVSPNIVF
ncbi:Protein maternal effect lethal 26 [Halotydeus destructor]|nr:Protein maternal effect lethal 26 [Halotydeus destructor]